MQMRRLFNGYPLLQFIRASDSIREQKRQGGLRDEPRSANTDRRNGETRRANDCYADYTDLQRSTTESHSEKSQPFGDAQVGTRGFSGFEIAAVKTRAEDIAEVLKAMWKIKPGV